MIPFRPTIQKLALIVFSLFCFCLTSPAQQKSEGPLTNAAVIKLVKAGFKEKTIIAIIQTRPNQFNLGTDQLVQLKQNGVSENIILTMLSLNGTMVSEDDWDDDESFMRRSRQQADSMQNGSSDPGTNIFGSSGGSKSRSQSRGGQNGNQSESNVTGSATVRIIRPPGEAGGAPAKLERTPTLTNETVIQLVEAGFSEGTIIKRIESSPVEFDLSTAKLEELRKRRVSESIIAAMSSAMSEDGPKPNRPELEREK